jgi:perosamine synthetase
MRTHKKIAMFQPYVSEEALGRVHQVLCDRWIGQGGLVDEFERNIERMLDVPHTVAVNASSSAIRLALTLCGVRPGDEIITTPMTCTLTNHPILEQFARIVFADIQYDSGNIDSASVEPLVTPFTKAIICTHWAGQPADLRELNEIADRHGLSVIEDASEAFGATYLGKAVGSISRFTAFSFQAIQILTTGEGGLLAVRDEVTKRLARMLRWYGINRDERKPNALGYYDFDITSVGYGYHMTNIAAALGLENLKTLRDQQAHRHNVVECYRASFADVPGITLLPERRDRVSSNHFFTMHVERRDDFCRKMKEEGIEVSIVHYRNDAYSVFGGLRKNLPGLDRFSKSYVGLPTHMYLAQEDVEYIISTVKSGW